MVEKNKLGKLFLPSLTLILLLVAIELYLPTLVTEQIQKAVSIYFYNTDQLTVKHQTRPAGLLLFGQVKNLAIEGRTLEGNNLKLNKLFLESDKMKISFWDLVVKGRLQISHATGRFALSITEKELDRYLHRFYIDDPYNEIQLQLSENGPRIQGLLNGEQFYLECMFTVEQKSIISLAPRKMVSSNSNTSFVFDRLNEVTAYSINLHSFGIPLIIDEISIADGFLYVFGTVSN